VADSRRKNSSWPQRNGERAAAVLTDSFSGRGGDEGRSATEKHGGGAWRSESRCLRNERVKLGWGVSVVRHGEMEQSGRRGEQPAVAWWSFNGATVSGEVKNGEG
jgi:hypothetical protein